MSDLAALRQAREYVTLANRLLEREVLKARLEQEATWTELGEALGVTHQGARARWSRVVKAHCLATPSPNGGQSEDAHE